MNAKHISGPWIAEDDQSIYAADGDGRRLIAECHAGHKEERAANARLIAAAPDLLEALQEMVAGDAEAIEDAKRLGVPFPDEMLAAYHKARAAIARATGEQP